MKKVRNILSTVGAIFIFFGILRMITEFFTSNIIIPDLINYIILLITAVLSIKLTFKYFIPPVKQN